MSKIRDDLNSIFELWARWFLTKIWVSNLAPKKTDNVGYQKRSQSSHDYVAIIFNPSPVSAPHALNQCTIGLYVRWHSIILDHSDNPDVRSSRGVLGSLRKHRQSRDHNFLHRNSTPPFFATPKNKISEIDRKKSEKFPKKFRNHIADFFLNRSGCDRSAATHPSGARFLV